ncbi:DEAD/SNF2-like helicase [Fadolivirus algeromassiliense]|uniref:DEAD/SNF2-like helicase n=1 Tax=Fadolivirus FV1/VV64 TaxID=3070911 RepID=A0A7D3V7E1_9VIRU|nr:DEAD/SNF2-like helicase [Fadolivirus algeromassiliense]QKF93776.1 DEAD/SNF2-like helicase [Fadolivirus FV1/VV64]
MIIFICMDYDKLHRRINHMIEYETDDFFVNINLKPEIADKLLEYQFMHVFNLMTAFRSHNIVLDGSDMGTGKTYTAIALCKQLNIKPFIICPKPVISNWRYVCDAFNVTPLGIVNYECIKAGKYYDKKGNRVDCNFIEVREINKNNIEFKWKLPRYSVVIFDEVHKCKNTKSQNGKLLLSTKDLWKVLMLSATLSDKPETFHIYGYMLGCYKNIRQASNWIHGMLLEDKSNLSSKPQLSAINKYIYPERGSRMRISELGDKFPSNQISADCYYIDEDKRELVNNSFKKINELSTKLNSALETNNNAEILKELTKARMLLEELKISIIEEMANDYIENGYNVVIFVNFNNTINKLSKILNTDCIVNGGVTDEDRNNNIEKFQSNKSNIIICNISIASGISLHDLHGVPRVSIISPSFSSYDLIQSLGRICRAGSKTPALQRIIYCANTCETIICNRLKEKLKFLSKLNDSDLINID